MARTASTDKSIRTITARIVKLTVRLNKLQAEIKAARQQRAVLNRLSNFDRSVRQDIKRDGLSVICVSDATPQFAYSIGLWQQLRQPEIIVFGLPNQLMHSLISAIAQLTREGQQLNARIHLKTIGGKFGVTVQPAHAKYLEQYFGYALGYYGGKFPIAQVAWPDSDGHFPGEPNYNNAYGHLQPALS